MLKIPLATPDTSASFFYEFFFFRERKVQSELVRLQAESVNKNMSD